MPDTEGYATVAEVSTALQLDGTANSATLEHLIEVASGRIDYLCGRTFKPATQDVRVYQCGPSDADDVTEAVLDDLQSNPTPTLSVAASEFAAADEWTTLTADAYRFDRPAVDDLPVTLVRIAGNHSWLRVDGHFGWPSVPKQIRRATILLTSRLWRREPSPLGTVASGGELGEQTVQTYDPDIRALVQSYRRRSIA